MKRILPLFFLLFPLAAIAQLMPDISFGDNGFVYLNLPTVGYGQTNVKQQSDGKLIFSGGRLSSTDQEDYILRLDASGNLDPSFGSNGYYFNPVLTLDTNGPDVYLRPDDSILSYSTSYGASLIKLTPDGTPDLIFSRMQAIRPFMVMSCHL